MKTTKKPNRNLSTVLALFFLAFPLLMLGQGVVISEDKETTTPHESAILEVRSDDKGILIPSLTTLQRGLITNPADGLLVYDTDEGSFFYYDSKTKDGKGGWLKASSSWFDNDDFIFIDKKVAIGLEQLPAGSLGIGPVAGAKQTDPLFEVKNNQGEIVFAVYPDRVEVIIDENEGKTRGGFAVSGRTTVKGETRDLFVVTPDKTRVYVDDTGAKTRGGFAVSGRTTVKDNQDIFLVTSDSTRVYLSNNSKTRGGFAVSGRTTVKSEGDEEKSEDVFDHSEGTDQDPITGFSNVDQGSTKGLTNDILFVDFDRTHVFVDESNSKTRGGFAVSGRTTVKEGFADFFNVTTGQTAEVINSEARVVWYPQKEAFLAGRVLVESPDSVGTNSWASGYHSKSIGNWSQALGYEAIARGDYSTAIGKNAVASGNSSFAFGDNANAIKEDAYAFGAFAEARGIGSFAFGYIGRDSLNVPTGNITIAEGDYSFAFGLGSRSAGLGSFAIGSEVYAASPFSLAMGNRTQASHWYAISMGVLSVASGNASMAFGRSNEASGDYSIAMGGWSKATHPGTISIGLHNRAEADFAVAIGRNSWALGESSISIGLDSEAKRQRSVSVGMNAVTDEEISISIGHWSRTYQPYSIAIGSNAEAKQSYGIAIGMQALSDNAYAVALGYMNTASGEASTVTGFQSTSSGDFSFSTGRINVASGNYSAAFGESSESIGEYSFAMGRFVNSIGNHSFAVGQNSVASGEYSFVMGQNANSLFTASHAFSFGSSTEASGNYAIATGLSSEASGMYSIASGYQAISSGQNSLSIGWDTKATDNYSIAFGSRSEATHQSTLAIGETAKASAFASTAIGYNVIANKVQSVSMGYWNNPEINNALFILGNGINDVDRTNAFSVLRDGKTGIGNITPTQMLDVDGQVRIRGGSPGLNKVLASDNNGVASWKNISELGGGEGDSKWAQTGDDIYRNLGNVGVGTTAPSQKLDVDGQIRIRGGSPANNRVLTATGTAGTATWKNLSELPGYSKWFEDGDQNIIRSEGNVGIGFKIEATQKLDVDGQVRIRGGNPAAGKVLTSDANGVATWETPSSGGGESLWEKGVGDNIFRGLGYVGVGTNKPQVELDVDGNVRVRALSSTEFLPLYVTKDGVLATSKSDKRLKENIKTIDSSLEKVMNLRGVTFTWKDNPESGNKIGFIAQEMNEVLPELVFLNNSDDYLGVNYAEMTAVLVEAIKEQQHIIDSQRSLIDGQKNEMDEIRAENQNLQKQIDEIKNMLIHFAEEK